MAQHCKRLLATKARTAEALPPLTRRAWSPTPSAAPAQHRPGVLPASKRRDQHKGRTARARTADADFGFDACLPGSPTKLGGSVWGNDSSGDEDGSGFPPERRCYSRSPRKSRGRCAPPPETLDELLRNHAVDMHAGDERTDDCSRSPRKSRGRCPPPPPPRQTSSEELFWDPAVAMRAGIERADDGDDEGDGGSGFPPERHAYRRPPQARHRRRPHESLDELLRDFGASDAEEEDEDDDGMGEWLEKAGAFPDTKPVKPWTLYDTESTKCESEDESAQPESPKGIASSFRFPGLLRPSSAAASRRGEQQRGRSSSDGHQQTWSGGAISSSDAPRPLPTLSTSAAAARKAQSSGASSSGGAGRPPSTLSSASAAAGRLALKLPRFPRMAW